MRQMGQDKQRAGGGNHMIEEVVGIGRRLMVNKDILRAKINIVLFDGTEVYYNSDKDLRGEYDVFFKKKGGTIL